MGKETKIRQIRNAETFEGYFETIYSEFFKPLYLYARSIAGSDDIAKDVVSDVFFNLWKSGSDLGQVKELKSYLFRSVKNQVIRTLSHDPRNFESIDTENYVKQVEKISPEDVLIEKELIVLIEKAMQNLPDHCRLIFDMAKNQQMKYADISRELGISESTVKTQVARAVAIIKETIESHYHDQHPNSTHHVGIGNLLLLITFLLS